MAVYVDNPQIQYGRMKMCHMLADSREELDDMADVIGVARKWIQTPPKTKYVHYDICLSKRALAVEHGAKEVSTKELVKIIRGRNG